MRDSDGNRRPELELLLLLVLVGATVFAILVAEHKLAFLAFFQIPVLVASYFLGRRQGVMVATLAVLMVGIYAVINPTVFIPDPDQTPGVALFLWGAFLIVTAYVVGTLYEAKATAASDLRQAYEGLVDILSELIDAVDHYADNHSVRVARLAARIGVAMNLPVDQIENIRVAGLLHDIQKADVSIDVLRKAAQTDSGSHEGPGLLMAKRFQASGGLLRDVVPLIESYNERFDGEGAHGQTGEAIPLGSRVLAVADALDRAMAPTPYGQGLTAPQAIMDVEALSGTSFDPTVIDATIVVFESGGLED
ncbi:MAG: HD domain-containing protein [Coriobacteriia bacterium]|nr:HD domain-containing protein [Coriobacteriia bacterium]